MAKRISIINFKGGVGKTTLAFHLGTGLAWIHDARVLLIDVDHQSSLSILCMRPNGWQSAIRSNRTIVEVFRSFVNQQANNLPADEIIAKSPMHTIDTDYDTMDVVPADLGLDNLEIELTSSLPQGTAIRSEWDKRTLLCRWIEETGIDERYDYIIFDCPPATKIVSQNAIAASHSYIVPVVPEAVMERGAPHLREMMRTGIDDRLKALAQFGEHRDIHVPDTELVGLVITRIQSASGGYTIDHTQHLGSLRRRWSDSLIRPYISQGIGVSEALSRYIPVYNMHKTQNVGKREIDIQYMNLTSEIKKRIDGL